MKLSKKSSNIIKLVNKIVPTHSTHSRTKSASIQESRTRYYKKSRPQTAVNSQVRKQRNKIIRSLNNNYIKHYKFIIIFKYLFLLKIINKISKVVQEIQV